MTRFHPPPRGTGASATLALYARLAREPSALAAVGVLWLVSTTVECAYFALLVGSVAESPWRGFVDGLLMGLTDALSWWVVIAVAFCIPALVPMGRRSRLPGVLALLAAGILLSALRYALMTELWLRLGWTEPHDVGATILLHLPPHLLQITAWMGAGYGAVLSLRQQDEALALSRRERELADAHFQSLRSRLDPDFLLGAFASLDALMRSDVRAADRHLLRLSELLRLAYRPEAGEDVRLGEELKLVRLYADILGEGEPAPARLCVRRGGAPDERVLPRMSVLPVVAAVLRRSPPGGVVEVAAAAYPAGLRLEVHGRGGAAHPHGDAPWPEGVVLLNQALAARFGPAHVWALATLPDGSLSAALSLPAADA